MPQIIIERTEGSLADRFRAYRVIIDGVYRGNVRQREKWSFAVPAGTHTVILRVDLYSSPPIKVAVANRTRLVCRSSLAHALGLLALLSPGSWISVHEDEETAEAELPYPGDLDWKKLAGTAPSASDRRDKNPSKDKPPGALRLSHRSMDEATQMKRSLELDLREAVTNGALELRYEPQVDVAVRRVSAFEALLRWRHPVLGKVPAADFIPLAEDLGLIGAIGQQVLERACHEAATWPADVSVAVNISERQIKDGALAAVVASALQRSGLQPQRLILEVAETVAMRGAAAQVAELQALRAAGVRIAVNDFGMAYSSLRTDGRVPVDLIKINRLLVSGLEESKDRLAMVRATINYCAGLTIPCCAVGVESQADLAILTAEQCALAQGHVFGPALAAREVHSLLARMNPGRPGAVSVSRFMSAIPFAEIVDAANDVVMVTTADLGAPGPTIVYVNPAFTRMTGYAARDVIGLSPRILQGPGTSRDTLDRIRETLQGGRIVNEKILNYAKGGAPYWLDLRISPVRDESGMITHFASLQRDVTMDKRLPDELDCASERDTLTGVPIRRTLLRALEAEIRAALASPGTVHPPCVAALKVEGLERLIASSGQVAADGVMAGVADRLTANIRRVDLLARTGDAEFAVCMPNVRRNDAKALAQGLQNAVASMPVPTSLGPVPTTISWAVAAFASGDTAESMLGRAAGPPVRESETVATAAALSA